MQNTIQQGKYTAKERHLQVALPLNVEVKFKFKIQKLREDKGITFVHGKGKRKTQLQRDVELLKSCIAHKAKYQDYNASFKGRNRFSKTDRDATFMRMKDDHMKNGQLKPGYNLQLGIEGEYIVGVDISSERSDQNTLLPLLSRMDEGLKKAGCEKRHQRIPTREYDL